MLYKNDVIYELVRFPKEVAEVEKFFHNKFPVKVIYPPGRIVPSRLPHNRLPDKPNSISFDLKSVVKTNMGTETWRYAEEVVVDNKGNKRYTPKKFRFAGSRYLGRDDIELIYFLLKKSEHRYKSQDELSQDDTIKQSSRPKFMFEDLIGEAEKKAMKKSTDLKIGRLLFSDDEGLPEEKLRSLARAFFIKGIDDYSLAQVRIILDEKIHRTKNGEDRFFSMVENDTELNNRVSIQKAIDKKLIFFDEGMKKWFWRTDDEKTKLICNVPPSKNSYDALFDLFLGDDRFQADLKAALMAVTPKAKKVKAVMGDNTDENE